MPETTEPTPAPPAETASPEAAPVAPAPLPERHEVGPHGEPPAEGAAAADDAKPEPPREPKGPPLPTVEPRVGQRAKIHLPERRTESGRLIPVMRPGNPPRAYQEGEVVKWDDHMVFLRQEGAVLATEIVEEK